MQQALVYIMLFSWPLVASWLFTNLKLERAVIWAVILPYMLLPVGSGIDLPVLPVLDKRTIPNIVLLFLVMQHARDRFSFLPENSVARILFLMLLIVPFITAATNPDPLIFVQNYIPGLGIKDAINFVIFAFVTIIPFIVGRCCLGSIEAHRDMLKILVIAGLAYTIPMLIEIRLSPQMHVWFYGYFPSDAGFVQAVRQGGFRPVVFMGHGLLVAFFTMFVTIAAAALWRDKVVTAGQYLVKMIYLLGVLVLCKTLGALVYALFALPLVLLASRQIQLLVTSGLVLITLAYPALRGADMIPVDDILELASSHSEERAQSLGFRFHHEEDLLKRASERPYFGWGSWGRNHLHDPITGFETSVTDGHWIIVIGVNGWVGYIATFGLLAWPVLLILGRSLREGPEYLTTPTAALCLLLGINMIELLPNATILPLTWLIVGSLLGYAEAKEPARATDETAEPVETAPRQRTIL